jgi:hypothetical protein
MMSSTRNPRRFAESPLVTDGPDASPRAELHACLDYLEEYETADPGETGRREALLGAITRQVRIFLRVIFAVALVGIAALLSLMILFPRLYGSMYAPSSRTYHILALVVAGGVVCIVVASLAVARSLRASIEHATLDGIQTDTAIQETTRHHLQKLRETYL